MQSMMSLTGASYKQRLSRIMLRDNKITRVYASTGARTCCSLHLVAFHELPRGKALRRLLLR